MHHADLSGLDQGLADDLDEIGGLLRRDRATREDRFLERVSTFEQLHRHPGLFAARTRGNHACDACALNAL